MTKKFPTASRAAEKGNVMIYIFIAIIALAALIFAVSSNNREGLSTVDRERSELLATQVLDYAGMIRRSVQMLKADGHQDSNLCFHSARWGYNDYDNAACADAANQIFSSAGGGAVFQDPAEDLFDAAQSGQPGYGAWVFTGANAIQQVGSDCATPGDAECNELLAVLPYLKQGVCLALNKRLQIDNPAVIPVDDPDFVITSRYAGQYVNGKALDAAALYGRRSGCFQSDNTPASGSYVFFAVLIAR